MVQSFSAHPLDRHLSWMKDPDKREYTNYFYKMRTHLDSKARHIDRAYRANPAGLLAPDSPASYRRGQLSATGKGVDDYRSEAVTKAKNDAKAKLNGAIRDMNTMLDRIGNNNQSVFGQPLSSPGFSGEPPASPDYNFSAYPE